MAHDDIRISTQRIVPVENLTQRHDVEGVYFPPAAVLSARNQWWMPVREARDHGAFHLRLAIRWAAGAIVRAGDAHGFAYFPIHPSMTAEDVEGATYAHDDGTHWLLAHCSPQEQIDFAADAEAYTRAQLGLAIDESNVALSVATGDTARTKAKAKVDALIEFAKAAGRRAHALVVAQTLGHYHRDPHHDHLREIAWACINAQQLDWIARASRDDDSIRVQAAVNAVKMRLASEHAIEWRHAREKRLNDAAAARGDDPVAGYEYCYVLSQTAAVITGESNLPDPAWPFDRLRTGTIGRGLFVYSDAEPRTNALLSWIVRFKRPIPKGTQPGADIGSVAWTQEAAYQPTTD